MPSDAIQAATDTAALLEAARGYVDDIEPHVQFYRTPHIAALREVIDILEEVDEILDECGLLGGSGFTDIREKARAVVESWADHDVADADREAIHEAIEAAGVSTPQELVQYIRATEDRLAAIHAAYSALFAAGKAAREDHLQPRSVAVCIGGPAVRFLTLAHDTIYILGDLLGEPRPGSTPAHPLCPTELEQRTPLRLEVDAIFGSKG